MVTQEPIKRMNTHAFINITDLLSDLENGNVDDVISALQMYHTKESREWVFSDKEILLMTSSTMETVAEMPLPDPLIDKTLRVLVPLANSALKKQGI